MDPFERPKQEVYPSPVQENQFPDFNIKWVPPFEEGLKTKAGDTIIKVEDVVKKSAGLYLYGVGLTVLLIFLPTILKFFYELSRWAFNGTGSLFR